MTTTEKAKQLQAISDEILRKVSDGGIELPFGVGITLDFDSACFLAEVLRSLQWTSVYDNGERNEMGREFLNFETADYIGRLAEGFDYIETVGIIRLKDDEI